jgi:hypothetical protein
MNYEISRSEIEQNIYKHAQEILDLAKHYRTEKEQLQEIKPLILNVKKKVLLEKQYKVPAENEDISDGITVVLEPDDSYLLCDNDQDDYCAVYIQELQKMGFIAETCPLLLSNHRINMLEKRISVLMFQKIIKKEKIHPPAIEKIIEIFIDIDTFLRLKIKQY